MGIVLFTYTVASFLILPADKIQRTKSDSKPTFDFAGTITGVTGLILSNFAWNQAGVVGWQVLYTYVLLVVGILFFAAFVFVKVHVAQQPLVPIKMLSKEAAFALSIIACGGGSFGIWVYYLWQLIENLRHHNSLPMAAQQIPVAISRLVALLLVGFLISRIKVA